MVQWKLPSTVSSFVQRAGRVARGDGREGLAVLLVERSTYEVDILKHIETVSQSTENGDSNGPKKTRKGKIREAAAYPRAEEPKEHAAARGALRGGRDAANDKTGTRVRIPVDRTALDEGLHTLAQTGTCRREVLTHVYDNKTPGKSQS